MEVVGLNGSCWVEWKLLGSMEVVGLNGSCWVEWKLLG